METPNGVRQGKTIDVTASQFSEQLDQLTQTQSGSVYSRLALIHQVAKAFATEALNAAGSTPHDLTIDELTDPPLYEWADNADPVIIQFSYFE
ncbi:MAG: hypothetical protein EOO81_08070 [Oxalobacteraceae bacterium]|nr:MAG: hypothetical protein EOO81_08070 [Oxalobacteraceae bacterium]